MTKPAYKRRIAESKARLDAETRALADRAETAADLIRLCHDRSIAIDPDYARTLTDK